MYYATTNKTAESWKRGDIRALEPDQTADAIIERVRSISVDGLMFASVVDCYKTSLASWRRFYKQDDTVSVEESVTADNLNCTRLQSMNIVFCVMEKKGGGIETKASLVDFPGHAGS